MSDNSRAIVPVGQRGVIVSVTRQIAITEKLLKRIVDWSTSAKTLYELQDWKGMFDWCQKWIEAEPEHADAWFYLGISYYKLQRDEDAVYAYRQALHINPKHAPAWHNLGFACAYNHYEYAVYAYRRAASINPEYFNALTQSEPKPGITLDLPMLASRWEKGATASEKRKDWGGMFGWCRKWTENEPQNSWAWYALGNSCSMLDHQADAVYAYLRVTHLDSENASAWKNLGLSHHRLNHHEEAISAYCKAISIDPSLDAVWYNLRVSYGSLNNDKEVVDAYRQAHRINPELVEIWINLGVAYYNLNRDTEVFAIIEKLRRFAPEETDILLNLVTR